MDAITADGAGVTDPRTAAARRTLLRALLAERFLQPMWPPIVTDEIRQRRRILLGKDTCDG